MADLVDLFAELRKECDRVGGQSEWARKHDVTPQALCDFLTARRPPSQKILDALKYQRRVIYVRSNHA